LPYDDDGVENLKLRALHAVHYMCVAQRLLLFRLAVSGSHFPTLTTKRLIRPDMAVGRPLQTYGNDTQSRNAERLGASEIDTCL